MGKTTREGVRCQQNHGTKKSWGVGCGLYFRFHNNERGRETNRDKGVLNHMQGWHLHTISFFLMIRVMDSYAQVLTNT